MLPASHPSSSLGRAAAGISCPAKARVVRFIAATGALLAVALDGCAHHRAYRGPQLPESQRATLRVVTYRGQGATWNAVVEKVDGEFTPLLFKAGAQTRNVLFDVPGAAGQEIELAPGPHTLEIGFFWAQMFGGSVNDDPRMERCTLSFEAEPGAAYRLESTYESPSFGQWVFAERDWIAWIVREDTGHVVNREACIPQDTAWLPTIPTPWLLRSLPTPRTW